MGAKTTLHRSEQPGDSVPYVIERYSGRQTNLGGDVFSVPVGSEETGGEFALVETTSTRAEEPATPMHYHEDEHDVFICLRGALQVWADGESRILRPGDLGSVPPGTEHAYQPIGPKTDLLGLIDTGGWEEFFFEGGEAYDGPPYTDKIEIDEEEFGKVAQKYGVNVVEQDFPEPDHGTMDQSLPGKQEPYFLESGYGSQYALGGVLATTLVTDAESDGSFGIVSYEGGEGTGLPAHEHEDAAKAIYVLDGEITGELDGTEYVAREGEYVNVPPGTTFSYSVADKYAQILSFTSGESAHRLAEVAGEPWEHFHNPRDATRVARGDLERAAEEIDLALP